MERSHAGIKSCPARINKHKKCRKEATMEELQKVLIAEIGKQLKADKMNVQLLDVLNRLLGTVNNYILSDK